MIYLGIEHRKAREAHKDDIDKHKKDQQQQQSNQNANGSFPTPSNRTKSEIQPITVQDAENKVDPNRQPIQPHKEGSSNDFPQDTPTVNELNSSGGVNPSPDTSETTPPKTQNASSLTNKTSSVTTQQLSQKAQQQQVEEYFNKITELIRKECIKTDNYTEIFTAIQDVEVMLGVMNKLNSKYKYTNSSLEACAMAASNWVATSLPKKPNTEQQITSENLSTLAKINNVARLFIPANSSSGDHPDIANYRTTLKQTNLDIYTQAKNLLTNCDTEKQLEELYNIYEICYNTANKYTSTDSLDTDRMSLNMAKKAEDLLNTDSSYNKILEIITSCASLVNENAQPIYQIEYKILQKIYTNGDNQFNSIDLQILANTVIACNHQNFLKFSDHFPIPQNHKEIIKMAAETVINNLTEKNINNTNAFQLQNYAYCLLQLKDTNGFQNNYKNQIQSIYNQLQKQQNSEDPCLKYCCQFLCEALGVNKQKIPNPKDKNIKVPNYLELLKNDLDANKILQDQD